MKKAVLGLIGGLVLFTGVVIIAVVFFSKDKGIQQPIIVLEGHRESISSANFTPDGTQVVTYSWMDATTRVWDVTNGEAIAVLKGQSDLVQSDNISPDKTRSVTIVTEGAQLLDSNGNLMATLDDVRWATFYPNQTEILTVSWNWDLKSWDYEGNLIRTFKSDLDSMMPAAINFDGSRIITARCDESIPYECSLGQARLWDKSETLIITFGQKVVYYAGFSPNGKWIATSGCDNVEGFPATCTESSVKLWDANGVFVRTVTEHAGRSVFSPNEKKLLTIEGNVAKLWEVEP